MHEQDYGAEIKKLGAEYKDICKWSTDDEERALRESQREPKFHEIVECVTDELVRVGTSNFKPVTEAGMDAACLGKRDVYDFHARIRLYEGIILSLVSRTRTAQQEINALTLDVPRPLTQTPSDIQIF